MCPCHTFLILRAEKIHAGHHAEIRTLTEMMDALMASHFGRAVDIIALSFTAASQRGGESGLGEGSISGVLDPPSPSHHITTETLKKSAAAAKLGALTAKLSGPSTGAGRTRKLKQGRRGKCHRRIVTKVGDQKAKKGISQQRQRLGQLTIHCSSRKRQRRETGTRRAPACTKRERGERKAKKVELAE